MKAYVILAASLLVGSAAQASTYRVDISTSSDAVDNFGKSVAASGYIELSDDGGTKVLSDFNFQTSGTYCATFTSTGTICASSPTVTTYSPPSAFLNIATSSGFSIRSGIQVADPINAAASPSDFVFRFQASIAALFDDAADGYLFREVSVLECHNCAPSHNYRITLSYGSIAPEQPDVGAVPLPATGALLLAGLGTLFASRRARRRL